MGALFKVLCVILGLILISFIGGASCEDEENTLELVHVLYRHGDRAPIELFPTDPNQEHNWPGGLGQLTKRGKAMQYKLGRWLRKRYNSIVSDHYVPEEVYARSTDVDRTLMSVQCNLASFFLPNDDWKFESNLSWVPTPIHTAPIENDMLLNVEKTCPRVDMEVEKQNELPEVKKMTEESKDLFVFLTEKSGKNISDILHVDYLYDTLYIEKLYNLTLPEWTGNGTLQRMKKLSDFSFQIVALSQELRRLKSGPIIGEMQKNMVAKAAGEMPKRKIIFYSAHDTTVATLLLGLGVFNNLAPPYATTVLIELHKLGDERFVQMFLRNDTSIEAEPYELMLPGCDGLCNLDKWVKLTSKVVPENWAKECYRPDAMDAKMEIETLAALITCGILALLLVVMFITLCVQRRQNNTDFLYQPVANDVA